MSVTATDVKKVAHLARISLNEQDISDYADSLSDIMAWVEQMNSVDTDGIEPMAHPQEASTRLRLDEVKDSDQRARFQAIAPATEAGLYLVPKVLE